MDPLRLYNYLATARERIFDGVRPIEDSAYRREFGIGLGSLARTLHHCRGAEIMYMRRICGERGVPRVVSPTDDPEVTSGDALAFLDLERSWRETASATLRGLEEATGDGWMKPERIESVWEGRAFVYEASPADFFSQLVVHEVHHRAQAMQMLRRLGVSVGEIDFSTLMFLPELPDS